MIHGSVSCDRMKEWALQWHKLALVTLGRQRQLHKVDGTWLSTNIRNNWPSLQAEVHTYNMLTVACKYLNVCISKVDPDLQC